MQTFGQTRETFGERQGDSEWGRRGSGEVGSHGRGGGVGGGGARRRLLAVALLNRRGTVRTPGGRAAGPGAAGAPEASAREASAW